MGVHMGFNKSSNISHRTLELSIETANHILPFKT